MGSKIGEPSDAARDKLWVSRFPACFLETPQPGMCWGRCGNSVTSVVLLLGKFSCVIFSLKRLHYVCVSVF